MTLKGRLGQIEAPTSYNFTNNTSQSAYIISVPYVASRPCKAIVNEWFASKPDPNGNVDDECLPEQADALKAYLHGSKPASEVAQALTRAIAMSSSPKGEIPRLHCFLMDALMELPSKHIHSLLHLIEAIEDIPEPDFSALEPTKRPSKKVWKGLPGFATLWSDANYRSGSWKMDAEAATGEERNALRNKHVRSANIESQLVRRGLAGVPIGWGYEVVDDALSGGEALLDFEVPAAAEWLLICGGCFMKGAQEGEESYVFEDGMSVKEWDMWEERLTLLHKNEGVVGRAATKALDAMHKVVE
jgi:hypothetical protein